VSSLRADLGNVFSFEHRHRRLLRRLGLVLASTALVDIFGTLGIYFFERHAHGTEVTSFGDAFFFVTVQLLTVSSQLRNPVTTAGRVVDVVLEMWAVIVVAGSAGAMAAFFQDAPG
jgi:hypothetical protein